jgi:hypothetical protein
MFQQDVKDVFLFAIVIPVDDVRFFALKMIFNERFNNSDDVFLFYCIHPFFFDESFE